MALDVINVNQIYKINNSSVFHPTYTLFSQNSKKRNLVCLYWSGYYTICTHQRNPTTAWRGHFELLGFPPGPNRTSLDNLATPGSPKVSMLTPSLVRTLVQHVTQCSRTPVLKPSSNSGLPIAWITEPATDPSQQKQWKSFYIKATIQLFPKFWEHG